MNSTRQVLLIILIALLTGCSTVATKNAPKNLAAELIARDFVNTMVQIDGLSPFSTVLQFDTTELAGSAATADKAFGHALRSAASQNGYSIQTVRGAVGQHRVRFSVTEAAELQGGESFTYDVSVGSIDFRRVYMPLNNGRVTPYRAMLVRGADVSNIQSDDSIFSAPYEAPESTGLIAQKQTEPSLPPSGFDSPVARNDAQRRLNENDQSVLPANESRVVSRDNASAGFSNTEQLVQEPSVLMSAQRNDNSGLLEGVGKHNIADIGVSNYDSLLSSKQNVAEQVLIFGDDSYVLGARNKQILGQVMDSFNPETDVVSIVGCSTGSTKIDNGNAALAIGRANRVKEALLYSGVPHDKIYDEGCWSPEANSTPFPNRGVVITVKRGVKNS